MTRKRGMEFVGDMHEKKLRIIEFAALFLCVIVTVLAMLRAAAWNLNAGAALFILWAISPYLCLYLADRALRKIAAIPRMPLVFCVISILMLAFTLLGYVGTLGDTSSTYALIFLFVPVSLFIGSFILLAVGLGVALFLRPS